MPPANAPRRKEEIPAGLALSPDGRRLYVALNLSNRLGEFDALTGKLRRTFDVGVAPYDVVLVGDKAYVSNWGGRRPKPGDLTGPAGRGTEVRVDPVRHIASEGSVSVIDLRSERTVAEILAGLHASALALHPNGRYVVCANAASDNISASSTRAPIRSIETIWAKQSPPIFSAHRPMRSASIATGKRLYVANGTQNAIAVIDFNPGSSKLARPDPRRLVPGCDRLRCKARSRLRREHQGHAGHDRKLDKESGGTGFNSHQYHGSLSLVPRSRQARAAQVSRRSSGATIRREQMAAARLAAAPRPAAAPVPERIGEPSVFKHVVYIIKENRTYDQVFGDDRSGNGDPSLCIFGERITPNQHKLAREFVLLDNTYCCGHPQRRRPSMEHHRLQHRLHGENLRRLPAQLSRRHGRGRERRAGLLPAGFIWDNALAHGKTLRNYGEFAAPAVQWRDPAAEGTPDFLACYRTWKGETERGRLRKRPGDRNDPPVLSRRTTSAGK